VSIGTINSSIVHPREVFRNAIINKANSVILCHNHPSGDVCPSSEDMNLTRRLKDTGDILGIRVLDHVIITGLNQNKMYSFKEEGVLEQAGDYSISRLNDIAIKEDMKEKRTSIVNQLKTQPVIQKDKQKTAPAGAEMER
jgi:DNA repair protein RadC